MLKVLLLFLFLSPCFVYGEEPLSSQSGDFKSIEQEEILPDIEARDYPVDVLKKSKSERVYLFQQGKPDSPKGDALPQTGKILLLTYQDKPKFALRVLKTYPDRDQFAASKVKTYEEVQTLKIGERFYAIEKVADILIPEYSLRDQQLDQLDLKELEAGMEPLVVPEYDPELDAGTSPPPGDNPERIRSKKEENLLKEEEDLNLPEEETDHLAPEEFKEFEPDHHWFTLQFAHIKNTSLNGGSVYYTGAGLRLATNIGHRQFAKSNKVQDSFSIEGGMFYYSVVGYAKASDSYTLMPLLGTIRYNLFFSEAFAIHFYAGLLKNLVVGSSNATPASKEKIGSFGPALGGGLFFRIGPKWYLRADLGIEMLGAGLVLRF